jgi:rsbT co-antagonist protein RsbR
METRVTDALKASSSIPEVLAENESAFVAEWIANIGSSKKGRMSMAESELRQQCSRFLRAFRKGFESGIAPKPSDPRWNDLRALLGEISSSRALQGSNVSEIASFTLSFKQPLFHRLREGIQDPEVLASQIWDATELLDSFGLYATELWLKSREEVIRRHQEEMLELSTPVVKLWNNILALPLVGTLDSARTQVVMESLLEAIVQTNSKIAILDITGVPTVDTVVAQHLLKTVTAARLMGADCIISGIRPQIAQTIVHLGINLVDITTKATLRDAFAVALERTGQALVADYHS